MARAPVRWLMAIVVLTGLALAVPFLVPLSPLVPRIEGVMSRRIGERVTIGALRLYLLPTPRLVASDVRAGGRELRVGRLGVVPDLYSFVSGRGRAKIRLIYAERVDFRESALALLDRGASRAGGGPQLARLIATRVRLDDPKLRLEPFDLDARFEDGRLRTAVAEARQGAVRLRLEAVGARTRLVFDAVDWRFPAGAPLLFRALSARGTLEPGGLVLSRIQGRLYGGTVEGNARAHWAGEKRVSGELKLSGVDVAPLQQAFDLAPRFSGRLGAQGEFSLEGNDALDRLSIEGPFALTDGVYQGVDLAEVRALRVGEIPSGGATRFEAVKGRLELEDGRVRVNELCVMSPALKAAGHVSVGEDSALSGRLKVSLSGTGGIVGVPIALSGSTQKPSLSLTRAAKIGAVLGTVLLPGIGTALGVSAGGGFAGQSACN